MVERNIHFDTLPKSYLFPEIQRRKAAFLNKNPQAKLISLGIGDTTQPIAPYIAERLAQRAMELSTKEGYSGYGLEEGSPALREKISQILYDGRFDSSEIFISDGANTDIGRVLHLFGNDLVVGVQNPTYPAYVETSIIHGKIKNILSLDCKPENQFFPDLSNLPHVDIIFFCSPNNPTGYAATREQLKALVEFALKRNVVIIFDAAYSCFMQDPELPRSIYEIEGAEQVAIEINTFSKMAGFTGIRLGWSIVPNAMRFNDGTSVNKAWQRVVCTFFNGASNIVQGGGMAVLEPEGLIQTEQTIAYYMQNASIIRNAFASLDLPTYGGDNAPYIWVDFSPKTSWEQFEELLQETQVLSLPGSGFGSAGEGFLRFSSFGTAESVVQAASRLQQFFAAAKI